MIILAAPDTGKAGPLGLLVLILLGIACYFLYRSMSGHLRRVRDDFPADQFPADQFPADQFPADQFPPAPAPVEPPAEDYPAADASPDTPPATQPATQPATPPDPPPAEETSAPETPQRPTG